MIVQFTNEDKEYITFHIFQFRPSKLNLRQIRWENEKKKRGPLQGSSYDSFSSDQQWQ